MNLLNFHYCAGLLQHSSCTFTVIWLLFSPTQSPSYLLPQVLYVQHSSFFHLHHLIIASAFTCFFFLMSKLILQTAVSCCYLHSTLPPFADSSRLHCKLPVSTFLSYYTSPNFHCSFMKYVFSIAISILAFLISHLPNTSLPLFLQVHFYWNMFQSLSLSCLRTLHHILQFTPWFPPPVSVLLLLKN